MICGCDVPTIVRHRRCQDQRRLIPDGTFRPGGRPCAGAAAGIGCPSSVNTSGKHLCPARRKRPLLRSPRHLEQLGHAAVPRPIGEGARPPAMRSINHLEVAPPTGDSCYTSDASEKDGGGTGLATCTRTTGLIKIAKHTTHDFGDVGDLAAIKFCRTR